MLWIFAKLLKAIFINKYTQRLSNCQYSGAECAYNIIGDYMDYIDKLISEREDRDLTQKEIGLVINKSQQGYDHIEKRRAKLTIEDFTKLCVFYNIDPDYFLGIIKEKRTIK